MKLVGGLPRRCRRLQASASIPGRPTGRFPPYQSRSGSYSLLYLRSTFLFRGETQGQVPAMVHSPHCHRAVAVTRS
jgi:hypothetical protein